MIVMESRAGVNLRHGNAPPQGHIGPVEIPMDKGHYHRIPQGILRLHTEGHEGASGSTENEEGQEVALDAVKHGRYCLSA
jgi:hypothetical protein